MFSPLKASFFSFLILLAFFFVGEGILRLFNVDVSSFAVAGSVVLFVIACEMTFGSFDQSVMDRLSEMISTVIG
jgi:multiple antibiotic resistance protein